MKKIPKALKIAGGVVLACAVGCGIFWMLSEDVEVRTMAVAKTSYKDSFKETAYVKKGESVSCVSEIPGTLISVNVAKNQRVKKGDIIAVISSKDLMFEKQSLQDEIAVLNAELAQKKTDDSNEKKEIRGEIAEANVELERIENARKQSVLKIRNEIDELNVELERIENERNKNDFENVKEVSPQTYVDVLKAALDTAKADLDFKSDELNSQRQLYEVGAVSKYDMDAAQKAYDDALTAYNEAQTKYNDALNRVNAGSLDNEYYSSIQSDFDLQLKGIYTKKSALEAQLSGKGDAYSSSTQRDFDLQAKSENAKKQTLEGKLANDNITSAEETTKKQIAQKQTQIAQIDSKIDRCTVRATAAGVVTELPAEKINRVAEGDVLAVIKTDSKLKAESDVLTNEEPYLKTGDKVVLTQKLKNDNTDYTGSIAEIYDYAEKKTSALGNDEYRVRVVVEIDDADKLKDGYELEADFVTYESKDALTVPNSSLFKKDEKWYIFRKEGGKAKAVEVELAHRGSIESEIASGINEGDEIIIDANTEKLLDGVSIKAEKVER